MESEGEDRKEQAGSWEVCPTSEDMGTVAGRNRERGWVPRVEIKQCWLKESLAKGPCFPG